MVGHNTTALSLSTLDTWLYKLEVLVNINYQKWTQIKNVVLMFTHCSAITMATKLAHSIDIPLLVTHSGGGVHKDMGKFSKQHAYNMWVWIQHSTVTVIKSSINGIINQTCSVYLEHMAYVTVAVPIRESMICKVSTMVELTHHLHIKGGTIHKTPRQPISIDYHTPTLTVGCL